MMMVGGEIQMGWGGDRFDILMHHQFIPPARAKQHFLSVHLLPKRAASHSGQARTAGVVLLTYEDFARASCLPLYLLLPFVTRCWQRCQRAALSARFRIPL